MKSLDKFGPIWCMSGSMNSFLEVGWVLHKALKSLFPKGMDAFYNDTVFVAKTMTLDPREGNMPMKEDGVTPKELFPRCIALTPWSWLFGVMLNAVGLSGPGAKALFERGLWQTYFDPFMLSFMSVAKTVELRLEEFEQFAVMFAGYLSNFRTVPALQANVSCPNVKVGVEKKSNEALYRECLRYLDLGQRYIPDVPIFIKVNTFMDPQVIMWLSDHPSFAGVCVSNTIHWDKLRKWQQWLYFPSSMFTGHSPLHGLGGGGLSGKPLLPLVEAWVRQLRRLGFTGHINAGGGIQHWRDVDRLKAAGADSVSIGTVVWFRPWRLHSIIMRAYEIFSQPNSIV